MGTKVKQKLERNWCNGGDLKSDLAVDHPECLPLYNLAPLFVLFTIYFLHACEKAGFHDCFLSAIEISRLWLKFWLADIHYVHFYSSLKRFISFSSVTRWVQLVLPGSTELRGHQELQLSLRLQLQPDLLVSHLPRCSAKQLKDNLLHVLSFFAWNLFTVLFVRLLVDWNSESVEVLWYWSLAVWSRGPEESAFEHLEQQLML